MKPTNLQTIWDEHEIKQFNPEYEKTNTFYADIKMVKGIQVVDHGANNVHLTLYKKALQFLDNKVNAVDVGCRDGEFTRYLTWSFDHVYCFDYRKRIRFAMNINIADNKVSHWTCALGDSIKTEYASGRGNFRSKTVDPRWKHKQQQKIYTLDHFKLQDVNLIKVDVDGMDEEVIKGAINTIKKYMPVIIIEELDSADGTPNHNGVAELEKLGYKVAYLHRGSSIIHKDYIMVPKHYITA